MSTRYKYVEAGQGTNYQWASDHTFVKVSAQDTDGMYTLMEDNLKDGFALGLHKHVHHAETFYVVEGSVDFYIDGDWITATKGACLHVPADVEHACTLSEGFTASKMLMIFQPSGFDQYLAEIAAFSDDDFADEALMKKTFEKHDLIQLGPMPDRPWLKS